MGRTTAEELSAHFPREVALRYHLQHNHYPPVSLRFLPGVKRAIKLVLSGQGEELIQVPSGALRSASYVVRELHLEDFCNQEDEE